MTDAASSGGPEAPWLDKDERAAWLAFATIMELLPAALDAQLQADAQISHFEYQVLAMLSDAPDRTARMGELAFLANGSQSRLTHVVTRLESRGWVRRCSDPCNRRVVLASLTEAGWDKIVASAPGHVDAVRRYVFDPLTRAQVGQLRDIAGRIRSAIGVEDCPLSCSAGEPE